MLFQLLTTLRIITAATTVVQFCFQGQPWGGFTSSKAFLECHLIRSTHPEVFLMKHRTSIESFSFKIVVLNICSEYFQEISSKTLATELTFSIVISFQYALS